VPIAGSVREAISLMRERMMPLFEEEETGLKRAGLAFRRGDRAQTICLP